MAKKKKSEAEENEKDMKSFFFPELGVAILAKNKEEAEKKYRKTIR